MSELHRGMAGRMSDGVTYRWLLSGAFGACDWCHHRVYPNQPRMQLHDGKGPVRPGGKGSRSSYLCVKCAAECGAGPPDPEPLAEEPTSEQESLW